MAQSPPLPPIPAGAVPPEMANQFSDTGAPGVAGIDIPMPMLGDDAPMELIEQPDGGVTIDVVPQDAVRPTPAHEANLAEFMDETVLNRLAEQVIEWKEADERSRSTWYAALTKGLDLLGWKFTDRQIPFPNASGVYDTMMGEAVLRNQATTSAEMLPASGPVKTQILGVETEAVAQQAERVRTFFNYFLTEVLPDWVEGREQMYLWRAIAGSVYTKTYQDPIKNMPVSPWLTPDQLIVSYTASPEMANVPRVSEIMTWTYKELRQMQLSGFYRDIELQMPDGSLEDSTVRETVKNITGVDKPQIDTGLMVDREFKGIEQHVDLDLEGFEHQVLDEDASTEGNPVYKNSGFPLPYIVTVEETTRKVLAIRRNWREGDDSYTKIEYYVHRRLFPGLGHHGTGFCHILGNPALAATSLTRQMMDAETLAMFPGGLRVKGLRMSDNNKMIGPCEFVEIDTGGLPINQAISSMPYKGSSQWSLELLRDIKQSGRELGSMADISVGDGRQDAPVGTTLALLEAANRMMSATVKSEHRAMKRELKLFAALFGQYLPDEPYPYPVPGGQTAIMRQDFSDQVDIIPVSDPNITSFAQRVSAAEGRLRIAQQFPQVHNIREAVRQMYVAMGTDEQKIAAILPAPQQAQPTDPLTENQMALTGQPLKAGEWQDHQAHIQAHSVLMEQVPNIAAHISEHLAMAMRVNVEKLLGIQLPPIGTKLPPEIENQIAVLVAQALQQLKSPAGPDPTPGQIAMAEIQVEAEKVQAKLREIEAKAAETAYKEQQENRRSRERMQHETRLALMQEETKRVQARNKAREGQRFGQRRSM